MPSRRPARKPAPAPLPPAVAAVVRSVAQHLKAKDTGRVELAHQRELAEWIADTLGVVIPDKRVCAEHRAPLEALADAYFGVHPRTVWHASRNFGGKSVLLGALSMAEAITLGAGVTLLGGSYKQSKNVHDNMQGRGNMAGKFWAWPRAPRHLLRTDPTESATHLSNGGWIEALTASQKSVRGPHPQRLRGDEVDEMDADIWDAATGQPSPRGNMQTQIVACSTLQHPDGTMARELTMAAERGWPVYRWCWRETSAAGGFITLDQVARQQASMSKLAWDVEYDLAEPSIEGRAIVSECVDEAFTPRLGSYGGGLNEVLSFEEPEEGAVYAIGGDWGLKVDKTIIWVLRCDVRPARLVVFAHLGREDYPTMVEVFERICKDYPGRVLYDAGGPGVVVKNLLKIDAEPVNLVGLIRTNLFHEWIAAIERGDVVAPRIEYAWREHKFCTVDDLFGRGHPPDSFVAAALAWQATKRPRLEVL